MVNFMIRQISPVNQILKPTSPRDKSPEVDFAAADYPETGSSGLQNGLGKWRVCERIRLCMVTYLLIYTLLSNGGSG